MLVDTTNPSNFRSHHDPETCVLVETPDPHVPRAHQHHRDHGIMLRASREYKVEWRIASRF